MIFFFISQKIMWENIMKKLCYSLFSFQYKIYLVIKFFIITSKNIQKIIIMMADFNINKIYRKKAKTLTHNK